MLLRRHVDFGSFEGVECTCAFACNSNKLSVLILLSVMCSVLLVAFLFGNMEMSSTPFFVYS